MPRNEDGEFELAVGTRQLLTLVFILMVLFGVVFSMGYFVGRSAGPESPTASVAARQPPAEPSSTAAGAPEEAAFKPSPDSPLSPVAAPAMTSAPGQTSVPSGRPSPGVGTPAASGQTAPVATAPVKPPAAPAETKPAPTSSAPPPTPAAPPRVTEPTPGQTFLQVAAVKRSEAELIVDVLKKKGFPAVVAPVPGETLSRVLVGPLADSAALAKTKTDLEQVGFRSIVRKY